MTAPVTDAQPLPVRERLAALLNSFGVGLTPPQSCQMCRAAENGRCGMCDQDLADMMTVSAAVPAVLAASSDDEARRAFTGVMGRLAGGKRYGIAVWRHAGTLTGGAR